MRQSSGRNSEGFSRDLPPAGGTAKYRQLELPLPDEILTVGQSVKINIPEQLGLSLAFIAYGVPVMMLLVGSVVARNAVFGGIEPNTASIIGGIAGFIGGLFAYKPLSTKVLLSSELLIETGPCQMSAVLPIDRR